MKKLMRFFRNLLIFIGWSFIFMFISNIFMSLVWNFNFLSVRSWQLLSEFWNNGGVIKTTADVLLISFLFLLPILWFIGFLLVLKINYIKIFILPLVLFDKIFGSKKNSEPERVVLKNMKPTQQIVEDIKNELESMKPEKSKEAGNIRSEITKKLSEEIKN